MSSRVVWLFGMCATLMIALVPFSSYVAALPIIQEEWGMGNAAAGWVFSAYLAGYAVSALFVLPLTDRIPPRSVFLASSVVSVVGNALFPLVASDPVVATALRLVAGVGLVGIYMPGLRIISRTFPEERRGAAMGLYVSAFYSVSAVSLFATGALMNLFEWRAAYLILSGLSALSVPLFVVLLRGRNEVVGASGEGRLRLSVLKERAPRAYIIGYSLHAMELYAVRVWLPALLVAGQVGRGVDLSEAAVRGATAGGVALFAGSVGPVMGGALSDRVGRARSAVAVFALSGACCLAIGWISGAPWPLVFGVAFLLGWAVAADSSIYTTAIAESARPELLGSTMAVQAFLGFMGGVLGPIFIGAILDVAPPSVGYGVGFSGVAILAVVAIAFLLPMTSARRRVA